VSARDERLRDLFFEDQTAQGNPAEEGLVRYVSGDLVALLGGVVKSLTSGVGGGITPGQHRALDQLIHGIAENSFEEITYTGNKVTAIIVWTTAGKTTKIREELFTYTGNQATTIVTKQYDGAGALIVGETMTETLSYTGTKIDDITRVMS
jgi:hypothetical protein